jgi:hypothetical protein
MLACLSRLHQLLVPPRDPARRGIALHSNEAVDQAFTLWSRLGRLRELHPAAWHRIVTAQCYLSETLQRPQLPVGQLARPARLGVRLLRRAIVDQVSPSERERVGAAAGGGVTTSQCQGSRGMHGDRVGARTELTACCLLRCLVPRRQAGGPLAAAALEDPYPRGLQAESPPASRTGRAAGQTPHLWTIAFDGMDQATTSVPMLRRPKGELDSEAVTGTPAASSPGPVDPRSRPQGADHGSEAQGPALAGTDSQASPGQE